MLGFWFVAKKMTYFLDKFDCYSIQNGTSNCRQQLCAPETFVRGAKISSKFLVTDSSIKVFQEVYGV